MWSCVWTVYFVDACPVYFVDCYSFRVADILKQLAAAAKAKQSIPELIRAARAEGRTWPEIAAAANMSRAGVIKLSKL